MRLLLFYAVCSSDWMLCEMRGVLYWSCLYIYSLVISLGYKKCMFSVQISVYGVQSYDTYSRLLDPPSYCYIFCPLLLQLRMVTEETIKATTQKNHHWTLLCYPIVCLVACSDAVNCLLESAVYLNYMIMLSSSEGCAACVRGLLVFSTVA